MLSYQFRWWSQCPVGYHGKEGLSHWGGKRSVIEDLVQALLDAGPFPQGIEHESTASGSTADKPQTAISASRSLKFLNFFRADEAGEAADQPFDGLDGKLVPTAEVIDNLGLWETFFGVPSIVGLLNILDNRAIFILTFYHAYIHAHWINM